MRFTTSLKFKTFPVSIFLIPILFLAHLFIDQAGEAKKHKYKRGDLVIVPHGPHGEEVNIVATVCEHLGHVSHSKLHGGKWTPLYRVVARVGDGRMYWVVSQARMGNLEDATIGVLHQRAKRSTPFKTKPIFVVN